LHTTAVQYAVVDKQLLSKLRKSTGFSFVNCRKALEKFDNDLKQAEKWLKDEAQKEGWAKASKLQGRPMSQGLIGLVVKDNIASLVEVNCETDFVARNLKFQSFVAAVSDGVLQHGKSVSSNKVVSFSLYFLWDLFQLVMINEKTVSDLTALEVGNLGENILVRRGVVMRPDKQLGQYLSYYIHTTGPKIQQSSGHCLLGKYGALVILFMEKKILTKEELGRQLCQHIVGMNPKCIGYDTSNSTNPKIPEPDDEVRMIYQEYMLDTNYKVIDVLDHNNVTIVDYVRIECGEDIEKEKEVD
ncbi:hypothetical protein HELRODRAFT_123857, partial [Helobdella robusta]|uniref:Elongation factor Ts, mitochondrial n=1 Tax=Helobdella robusta TaxID=6412 RepID=T1EGZ4_HELRO